MFAASLKRFLADPMQVTMPRHPVAQGRWVAQDEWNSCGPEDLRRFNKKGLFGIILKAPSRARSPRGRNADIDRAGRRAAAPPELVSSSELSSNITPGAFLRFSMCRVTARIGW